MSDKIKNKEKIKKGTMDAIKGIPVYFWILDNIGENLIELINVDYENLTKFNTYVYNIAHQVNRLLPITFSEKNKSYILHTDGIVLLEEHYDFLKVDFEKIVSKHQNVLEKLKNIRNKNEHEPHNIYWKHVAGDKKSKTMEFKYVKKRDTKNVVNKESLKLTIIMSEIIDLVVDLNLVLSKVQNKTREYVLEYQDHPCFNIDFNKKNKDILSLVGD